LWLKGSVGMRVLAAWQVLRLRSSQSANCFAQDDEFGVVSRRAVASRYPTLFAKSAKRVGHPELGFRWEDVVVWVHRIRICAAAEKQIPCGNDRKKGKSKCKDNCRFLRNGKTKGLRHEQW